MAIEFSSTTITVNRGLILTGSETQGIIQSAFLDDTGNNLYILANSASGQSLYWRRVDVSNPLLPTGHAWSPSSTAIPAAADTNNVDATQTQQMSFLDVSTGIVWMVVPRFNGTDSACHYYLQQINLGTGQVTYGQSQILNVSGGLSASPPIRGVVKLGNFIYFLSKSVAGLWVMQKVDVTAHTFSTIAATLVTGTTGGINATSSTNVLGFAQNSAAIPVGLNLSTDDKLLVFYDSTNVVEKYNTGLVFEGSTEWVASDIGATTTRTGYIWSLSNFNTSGENLVLSRWIDGSSNVVSEEKSTYITTERIVQIGENTSLPITFKARDGFGAPLTGVTGQLVRFSIVTSRGIIDSNDAALSTSPSGPFRDGSNVPLTRSLTVALNSSAEATAYFQSARSSGGYLDIVDTVRIEYPVV